MTVIRNYCPIEFFGDYYFTDFEHDITLLAYTFALRTTNTCMLERNVYISYLRVIATIFVILIHASSGFLYKFSSNGFDWNYCNWINAATRCAVPIFVMISGALLLQKDESLGSFYKKRIPKILYPLIFWNLVYSVYWIYLLRKEQVWKSLEWNKVWHFFVNKMINGGNTHLWYLYMIIGLYLAIPFIRKIVVKSSIRELEVFLALWFASMFFLNFHYNAYLPKIDLGFFSGYIGYLILGYYLTIKKVNWNKWLVLLGYGLIVSFTAIMTFKMSLITKSWNDSLIGYLAPTTALTTVMLFIFMQKISTNTVRAPVLISIIEKYSFGVYLVHILFLNYFHPLVSKYFSTVIVVPLATLCTLIASILAIYLLRKMLYGKYVSG